MLSSLPASDIMISATFGFFSLSPRALVRIVRKSVVRTDLRTYMIASLSSVCHFVTSVLLITRPVSGLSTLIAACESPTKKSLLRALRT